MANVWFVHRVGAEWKTLRGEPAYRRPLGDLIFKIDLGPQRRLATEQTPVRTDLNEEVTPTTKVFIEVVPEDLQGSHFGGYFAGWYDSPYHAPEIIRRLG